MSLFSHGQLLVSTEILRITAMVSLEQALSHFREDLSGIQSLVQHHIRTPRTRRGDEAPRKQMGLQHFWGLLLATMPLVLFIDRRSRDTILHLLLVPSDTKDTRISRNLP